MKGTSKVIMGATVVMVLSLAIVLGLVLVLLAELYCSLLLRRRQLTQSKAAAASASPVAAIELAPREAAQYPSPLSSFYAQGVLHAPRSVLFPSWREGSSSANAACIDVEAQHGKLHQLLSLQTALESATNSPPPPPPPPPPAAKPQGVQLTQNGIQQLVYICNPIYENEGGRESDEDHTPFETPDTSPTRLERVDEEDKGTMITTMATTTPQLTPIKQLPAKACSVALRDARSLLGTSGSESNSQNAAFSPSYSGSPSTSSW